MKSVRVRMYGHGLGDCFLLTFKTGAKPAHVLIDCGIFPGTKDQTARMKAVAANVLTETGGKLDVLVATHEHADHVSGFNQAKEEFAKLEIDKVWVAWTEDPGDKLAKELAGNFDPAFRAVAAAATRLADKEMPERDRELGARLEGLLGFAGGDFAAKETKAVTVDRAMDWVTDRQPRPPGLKPGKIFSALGVRVFVLGPPRSRESLEKNDPTPGHPETYHLARPGAVDQGFLAAAEAHAHNSTDAWKPFREQQGLIDVQAKRDKAIAGYWDPADDWRRIDTDWLRAAGSLALQFDDHINNTSLALAFELKKNGPVLLFPGDAQVGHLLSWEDAPFPAGEPRANDLLARTVLYKVGHHGSHNATLKEKGLELMTSPELVAMIPTDTKFAKDKKGWDMPAKAVKEALLRKAKGRVIAADVGLLTTKKPQGVSAAAWKRFTKRVVPQERTDTEAGWVDYTIEF